MRWSRTAIAPRIIDLSFSTTPIRPGRRSADLDIIRAISKETRPGSPVSPPRFDHFTPSRLLAHLVEGFFSKLTRSVCATSRRVQAGAQGSLMAAVDYFNADRSFKWIK